MGLFRPKSVSQLRAIKLYSTSPPPDREILVEAILKSFQSAFGTAPAEYDIHGPYGIEKGSTVGLMAFQSKLAKGGHDRYSALSGNTPGHFGFNLLLDARVGDTSYNELIVWYVPERYEVDFLRLTSALLVPLNVSCGFEIEIPSDHLVITETKVRKSIFGTTSVEVNSNHLAWIPMINNGVCRGLFKNNILNDHQLKSMPDLSGVTYQSIGQGLHFVHHSKVKNHV